MVTRIQIQKTNPLRDSNELPAPRLPKSLFSYQTWESRAPGDTLPSKFLPHFHVCLYSWCCTSFRSRWPEGSFIQLFRIYPIILSWALLQHQVLSPYNNLSLFVTEALTRVAWMMSVWGSRSGAVRGILSSFPVPSLQELCHAVLLPLQIFLHCCAQDCGSRHPVSGIWKDPVQWWGVPGNASKPCRSMRRLGKREGWGVFCLSEKELGNRSGK